MVDISQVEAEARAEVENAVREAVVEKLQAAKAAKLAEHETVKAQKEAVEADLNELDRLINERVPQPEPEIVG